MTDYCEVCSEEPGALYARVKYGDGAWYTWLCHLCYDRFKTQGRITADVVEVPGD